jgi:glutaminyl-peptide cyclotransferase
MKKQPAFPLNPVFLLALAGLLWLNACAAQPRAFDGQRAYQNVADQMALGERIPGSSAHAQSIQYIVDTLNQSGWTAEIEQGLVDGQEIQNVIAVRDDETTRVILGAHYDTRQYADQDPDLGLRNQPVPGANDGASGVAVLLEMARVLPNSTQGVMLVFFDAEDQGEIDGQAWIRGATYFVEDRLSGPDALQPQAAVIIDMIGDADLQVYYENNSDPQLQQAIWSTASDLGYSSQFIARAKYTMLDDHIPFRNAGIPAVDIIDFDYPYWHTTADTADKVSADSLAAVGNTLLTWLEQTYP